MAINGCSVNFQIDILGDRSSSTFNIDLSQEPVYYFPSGTPAHGSFAKAFDLTRGSKAISIADLSYNEPGNSISSASLAGKILSVTFVNAPGSTEPLPVVPYQLTGVLLVST